MVHQRSIEARTRRRARAEEQGYLAPRAAKGFCYIMVPLALRERAKDIVRSLTIHLLDDQANWFNSRFARDAALPSWKSGPATSAETKPKFMVHRRANRAKHALPKPAIAETRVLVDQVFINDPWASAVLPPPRVAPISVEVDLWQSWVPQASGSGGAVRGRHCLRHGRDDRVLPPISQARLTAVEDGIANSSAKAETCASRPSDVVPAEAADEGTVDCQNAIPFRHLPFVGSWLLSRTSSRMPAKSAILTAAHVAELLDETLRQQCLCTALLLLSAMKAVLRPDIADDVSRCQGIVDSIAAASLQSDLLSSWVNFNNLVADLHSRDYFCAS